MVLVISDIVSVACLTFSDIFKEELTIAFVSSKLPWIIFLISEVNEFM
ncbi:hypothetical protein SDC9_195245 [bioreactor metagenome]|uniref:Uncharacterized protein n=1 Tax=bioreactor metagenome TaxID=1076179 RepID=A0A645IA15_9ZZZZ